MAPESREFTPPEPEAEASAERQGRGWVGEKWAAAKEMASSREVQQAVGKAAYDTATSVFGVKTATDLVLALAGRGDIAGYFKERWGQGGIVEEKKELNSALEDLVAAAQVRRQEKETNEVQEGASEAKLLLREKIKSYKERIETAKHLPETEKKALRQQLGAIIAKNVNREAVADKERESEVGHVLGTYLETKIKGAKLAKDALNLALTGSGLMALRGVSYGLMAGIERAQKANVKFEKSKLRAGDEAAEELGAKERWSFIIKDVFVTSAQETGQALAFKGKKSRTRKAVDFAQAAGAVLRCFGIGGTALNEIWHSGLSASTSEAADRMLVAFENSGVAGVSEGVKENFMVNAERMAQLYLHPIDSFTQRYGGKRAELETPANGQAGPLPEEHGQLPETGAKPMEIPKPERAEISELSEWKDVIESTGRKQGKYDSIWASTRHIIKDHAQEMRYTGSIDDNDALNKWAETQTANLVNQLAKEQGGKIQNLVHDGDMVFIKKEADGAFSLRFEASSGIAPGHLPEAPEAKPATPLPAEAPQPKEVSVPVEEPKSTAAPEVIFAPDKKKALAHLHELDREMREGEGKFHFGKPESGELAAKLNALAQDYGLNHEQAEEFVNDIAKADGDNTLSRDDFKKFGLWSKDKDRNFFTTEFGDEVKIKKNHFDIEAFERKINEFKQTHLEGAAVPEVEAVEAGTGIEPPAPAEPLEEKPAMVVDKAEVEPKVGQSFAEQVRNANSEVEQLQIARENILNMESHADILKDTPLDVLNFYLKTSMYDPQGNLVDANSKFWNFNAQETVKGVLKAALDLTNGTKVFFDSKEISAESGNYFYILDTRPDQTWQVLFAERDKPGSDKWRLHELNDNDASQGQALGKSFLRPQGKAFTREEAAKFLNYTTAAEVPSAGPEPAQAGAGPATVAPAAEALLAAEESAPGITNEQIEVLKKTLEAKDMLFGDKLAALKQFVPEGQHVKIGDHVFGKYGGHIIVVTHFKEDGRVDGGYQLSDKNIDELFAPSRPEGVLEGAPADLEAVQTALSNLENIAGRGSVDYQTIAPFLNESSTFAPGQTLDTAKLEKLEVGDYNRFLEYFRFRTREIAKDYLNNPTPDNLEALRKRVLQKYATEAFGAEGWNWIDAAFSGPHKKVLESLQRLAQTEVKGG